MFCSIARRIASALLLTLATVQGFLPAQQAASGSKFPYPEKLRYHIEWHLVTAGTAVLKLSPAAKNWQTDLDLESAGMVTRLYRVLDSYKMESTGNFCGSTSVLDAQEGKRHRVTRMKFEDPLKKVNYEEHDLIKNSTTKKELEVPPCTHEITGALASLRTMDLKPGSSAMMPITDGKKWANAKIEAQARETITVSGNSYKTIRYEAYVFDNVLYTRKGRLLIWVTDDADRVPVQMRIQLGFPIGNISLVLDKQEKM